MAMETKGKGQFHTFSDDKLGKKSTSPASKGSAMARRLAGKSGGDKAC